MWIDIETLKGLLDKNATKDDPRLLDFALAACAAIERIKGNITPRVHTEVFSTGVDHCITLTERPIISVDSIETLNNIGTSTGALDFDPIADAELQMPSYGSYRVTYTSGRDPIPDDWSLAAYELALHLWRGSQLNEGGGRARGNAQDMSTIPGIANAMPYRVRELLGIYGPIVRSRVMAR